MRKDLLPNLVIAGAPKSGTSSLFRWLSDHPEVVGSSVKETRYFADPGTHVYTVERNFLKKGLDGYSEYFEDTGNDRSIVVEATPTYLYSDLAVLELPTIPTKPHFIFLLREPASQIRSVFRYFQQNWDWIPSSMTFQDFLDATRAGDERFNGNELAQNPLQNAAYLDYLLKWRDSCGAERMHVFLFEDVFRDPRGFMLRLSARFGIDPSFYDSYDFPPENQTYSVRVQLLQKVNIAIRPLLPPGAFYRAARSFYRSLNTSFDPADESADASVEAELRESFRETNEQLARAFNLDLAAWNHPRYLGFARSAEITDGAHVSR